MKKPRPSLGLLLSHGARVGLFALSSATILADDVPPVESPVKLQGFMSVVGGEVLSGSLNRPLVTYPEIDAHFNCPCYIADFANAGIYEKYLSFKPESHIGGQLDYIITPDISLTLQAIARAEWPTPDLQWAYLEYKMNHNWTIHAGRQRIPLYYYSDFQDIGLSYPWISPPQEIYGWEATNYNGVSIRYKNVWGDLSANGSLYAGDEVVHDDHYTQFLFSFDTNVKWHRIVGGNVELNDGGWTLRSNIIHADVTWDGPASYDGSDYDHFVKQYLLAYGATVNYDADNWFVLSEWDKQIRDNYLSGYTEKTPVWTFGAGMRLGKWTPFLNYAHYGDHYTYSNYTNYPQTPYPSGGWSGTVRYDLNSTSAFKLQYDQFWDQSVGSILTGNAHIIRASFDHVF